MSNRKRQADKIRTAAARRRKKSKRKYTLYYAIAFILLLAVGVSLSLTVFFQVRSITVEGSTRYAEGELIASSGIAPGQNLWRLQTRKAAQTLADKYPYIERATIERRLPDSVVIHLTQAEPVWAIETSTGTLLLDRQGRVLEAASAKRPEGWPRVVGFSLEGLTAGDYIVREEQALREINALQDAQKKQAAQERLEAQLEQQERYELLLELGDLIVREGLERVSLIDLSDPLSLRLLYDGRIDVEFGVRLDLDYKVRFAKTALSELEGESTVGRLDVSARPTASFQPIDLFDPAQWPFPDELLPDYERKIVKEPI
ncbi:MAG: FtsQ-type POTRA domain-containing protein, partial [Oscillospiraceae bacterium]